MIQRKLKIQLTYFRKNDTYRGVEWDKVVDVVYLSPFDYGMHMKAMSMLRRYGDRCVSVQLY